MTDNQLPIDWLTKSLRLYRWCDFRKYHPDDKKYCSKNCPKTEEEWKNFYDYLDTFPRPQLTKYEWR